MESMPAAFLALSPVVFVVSFLTMQVCSTNPEFDPLENVFNFQLKILPPYGVKARTLELSY
jgi:hypothetical protein